MELAACVSGYAARLHAAIGDGHHVASPLGAWLLLALAAPAAAGQDRQALAEVLGCDAGTAAAAAARLLADPHPEVASAAAAWTAPWADAGEACRRWQAGLPSQVTTGDLPDQAGLDSWARERTVGLIDSFPIERTADLYLVLASALATRVSWQVPFQLAAAADLGQDSPWSHRLTNVLRAPDHGHRQFIAMTPEAGDVAVHAVASQAGGLLVYSVAAGADVASGDVLAAAHQVACADAIGGDVQRPALAGLPLGEGPAWLLREEQAPGGGEAWTTVLPAWSAQSEHDLAGSAGLGFQAAINALVQRPDPWTARQAAMARYSRTGFEAAAVTATAVRASMAMRPATRRIAELRFGHPYAVVAIALGQGDWNGVPVFSAWVADPEDADDNERVPQ